MNDSQKKLEFQCELCHGTGLVGPSAGEKICPDCKGKGSQSFSSNENTAPFDELDESDQLEEESPKVEFEDG